MPVIKKAIQLKVLLWIEGEQEAAQDYAALATDAVTKMLSAPPPSPIPLKVSVKRISEYSSDEEEDSG